MSFLDRIVDSPARRLERISGEYSQMLYLISKAGPQIPFIESLSPVRSLLFFFSSSPLLS